MAFNIGDPIKLKAGAPYVAHVNGREAHWPHDATINLVATGGAVLASFVPHASNKKRISLSTDTTAQFQSDIETKGLTGVVEIMPVGSYVP